VATWSRLKGNIVTSNMIRLRSGGDEKSSQHRAYTLVDRISSVPSLLHFGVLCPVQSPVPCNSPEFPPLLIHHASWLSSSPSLDDGLLWDYGGSGGNEICVQVRWSRTDTYGCLASRQAYPGRGRMRSHPLLHLAQFLTICLKRCRLPSPLSSLVVGVLTLSFVCSP